MMVVNSVHWIIICLTLGFILLDVITGFTQAVVNKCVDSTKMKQGLWHKCGFLLAIIFGWLCEFSMIYIDLGFTLPIQNSVCLFIIATEIISILENLAKISPELSDKKFMSIFERNNK